MLPRPLPATLHRKSLATAATVVLAVSSGCRSSGPGAVSDDPDTDLTDLGGVGSPDDGARDTGARDTGAPDTGGPDSAPPESCVGAEDLVACCEALEAWCASAHDLDSADYTSCIYGPDFDGSTGCLAWGPPAPPAMA